MLTVWNHRSEEDEEFVGDLRRIIIFLRCSNPIDVSGGWKIRSWNSFLSFINTPKWHIRNYYCFLSLSLSASVSHLSNSTKSWFFLHFIHYQLNKECERERERNKFSSNIFRYVGKHVTMNVITYAARLSLIHTRRKRVHKNYDQQ